MKTELIFKLLILVAKHDITGDLLWTEDLEFAIICNDFFMPAADAEPIQDDSDLELLDQCMNEVPMFGELLYCAKKRKQLPQKGYFDFMKKRSNVDLVKINDVLGKITK